MSQTINAPRELLERLLYVMDNYVTHETPEEDQLRAILAAPRQPEGGIEPDITTKHGYPAYSVEQHQRAIAELREECERLRDDLEHAEHWRTLALQFDGQRMQAMALIRLAAKGEATNEHLAEFAAAPPMQASELIAERDALRAENEQYADVKSDLAAARLQTAMMVVCAKNLADERDALLATIELMQAKQQLVGYTMRSSLKPLVDDTMPDGQHIRIGVDHRVCWEDDTPYDNLIPLYVIGDV